ncbi:MAG: carbamate kinase [Candidatus Micrarchaeaceae archaeon]
MRSIVIALGGNALLSPSSKQSFTKENSNIEKVSRAIASLSKRDFNMIITHGNGTQIGDEVMRNEHSKEFIPKLPFFVLNAATQAILGTVVETSLRNNLKRVGSKRGVCTVLSHVIVDSNDRAFKNPSKQIGPFYSKAELDKELRLERFDYIKYGNKYRRVVASPMPVSILETDVIKSEMNRNIVVACGGGGVPIVSKRGMISGVEAVIDKDLTSRLLANSIGADTLIILTNADYVYSNYQQKGIKIKSVKASVIKRHIGMFEMGTIRPKIEACVGFIESGGKEAYIGNVFELRSILEGKSGTRIS